MCDRNPQATALLEGMTPLLQEELVQAFRLHPRLEKYFNEGHFATLYVALNGEGLYGLRDRLSGHMASLQEA